MRYRRSSRGRGGLLTSRGRPAVLLRLLPIGAFALYLAYYWFSHQEAVPLTGRSQLIDISREQEVALGLQSYQEILSQSDVLAGGPEVAQVRAIGAKLVAAARDRGIDPGYDWEFNVIRSGQANAFALPGGKVAVYTGLLPVAANVDGLSAIMGHEIAHAIARHGAERMAYQKLVRLGTLAASLALGDMSYESQRMVMGALGVGSQYGVLLPFSRSHESEADRIGLLLLADACFDPREAPLLWERMGAASGGRAASEFASTHPSPETRIRQFTEWMPEAIDITSRRCAGQTR